MSHENYVYSHFSLFVYVKYEYVHLYYKNACSSK